MIKFDLKVEFENVETVLKQQGLELGGPVQTFFTNEFIKEQDDYVPRLNFFLGSNITILPDKDGFVHNEPYSRYQHQGKKMIGHAPKELTDIDLVYNGAPLRGAFWPERMWADKGEQILQATQKYKDRGAK